MMFVTRVGAAIVALCLSGGSGDALAADRPNEAISIEISVLPALQRYVELLAYPSYLAIALENNGLSPSLSSRMNIDDGQSLQLRNAVIRFVGKKGPVFDYQAGFALVSGTGESPLAFPVRIDASRVGQGKIDITLVPPLARFFPSQLIDKVRFKVQAMADISAQKKLLEYLDTLAGEKPGAAGVEALFEPILIDAYNRGAPSGRHGETLPRASVLSDLVGLFVVGLLILPLALIVWRRRRA